MWADIGRVISGKMTGHIVVDESRTRLIPHSDSGCDHEPPTDDRRGVILRTPILSDNKNLIISISWA
jgi:hypothetical protein